MKVLVLAQYYPPDMGGGASRASNAAKGLHLNGCNVTVLAAAPHYPDGNIPRRYRWKPATIDYDNGVRVVRTFVPPLRSAGVLRRVLLMASFVISSLLALPLVGRMDFVWASNPNVLSFFPATFYARVNDCKLGLNVDDLWPEELVSLGMSREQSLTVSLGEVLANVAYARASVVTPVSPGYVKTIVNKYHAEPSKVTVVRAGVDPKMFRPLPRRERGKFLVLYSGSFSVAYDFDTVLEAARIVSRSHQDIEFLLQGKGELTNHIRTSIGNLGIANVRLCEVNLDRRRVAELLNEASVLLLPIRKFGKAYTGISSKLYEYQAVGVPSLCCADGPIMDYIHETNSGLVVPPGNASELASAIVFLYENPRVREDMGMRGREQVMANLTLKAIGSQLKGLLEDCLNGRAGSNSGAEASALFETPGPQSQL